MATNADPLPIQRFESADVWDSWLQTHHNTSPGLWMQISKKGSPVPSVTYSEALDVALCHGWIDGQKKSHDEESFLQKFTPRRPRSLWSQRNVERVSLLVHAARMRPAGQAEVDAAKADGRWDRAYAPASKIEVPEDFRLALEQNPEASAFFESLNKTQRYSFLWRIETAKRIETRQRRIEQFVTLLAEHKFL